MSNSAFEAVRRRTVAGAAAGRRAGTVIGHTAAATARSVKFWALASIALAAAIAAVITIPSASVERDAPAFLAKSLGASAPTAPLVRVSADGIRTAVTPVGYSFRNGSSRLTLASQDVVATNGTAIPWERRANGAFRKTAFGNEAIIFKDGQIEQLMTVGKRMGEKTWSWRIASNVGYPRVGDDGYVAFIKDHAVRQDIVIKPVVLFDAKGKEITPEGLRWSVSQDTRGYLLELKLNDKKLPIPYVIDPIAFRSSASSASSADVLLGVQVPVPKPAGLADGDLMFVQVGTSGNTGTTKVESLITGTPDFPALKNTSQSGTTFTHLIAFARILQTGEAAGTFAFTDSGTGDASQSYAVISAAFTGVQSGSVAGQPGVDIVNNANAPSAGVGPFTMTAPTTTPNQNNELIVWGFGVQNATTFLSASGGTEPEPGGTASSGGVTNTAATLMYTIGTTAGTPITGASVTHATATRPLAHAYTFRVFDTTVPTLTANTVKVASTSTITFDFDDSTGVGVAPTVPAASRFTALYTPVGGGSQSLTASTATISTTGNTGTVTLTFPGTPFTTPGSLTLAYTNANTSTTLTSNYVTSGGTISVGSTTNFSSTGNVLITGNSTGSLGVAYRYTPTAKTATTFTVTPIANLVGSIGTGSTISNRLQDRNGNPLATFTTQQVYMDGSGTITLSPNEVAPSSANEMTFTFTVPSSGMIGGRVEIDTAVATAAGWTTPQTADNTAAGYVAGTATGTADTPGTVTFSGGKIIIDGITGDSGETVIVKYGDTSSGAQMGARAVATASFPTTQLFQTQSKPLAAGTLTNVAVSPSVGVNIAPDGSGTMTVNPTSRAAGSTGETLTFTYTAASSPATAMSNGEVRLAIPSGWTAPTTTSGNPGYSIIGSGCGACTLSVVGSEIRVTGVTLAANGTFTIVYGSGVGGGVTVPQTPGQTATFTTTQRSLVASTLTGLATNPTVAITGVDGSGTIAVTNPIVATSTVNQHVFTYTIGTGGMVNGTIAVVVPGAWPTPQDTAATSTNYTTLGSGTASANALSISGNTVTIDGITGTSGQTIVFTYGDTSGGAPAITEPASAQVGTFTTTQKSSSGGSLTALASQPTISAVADGAGTCAISPTTVATSTSTTQTITCTIASGGMSNGAFAVTVPSSWPIAPQILASSSPGYTDLGSGTATSQGTVGVSGQTINVTGVSGTSGQTVIIRYGSTSGNPAGVATSPSAAETSNFAITQRSTGGGTLTSISSNPHNVTVTPPDGQGTCVVAPTSVATSTQTTQTFTCTIGAAGLVGGAIEITVPSGWTAPQTAVNTNAGFTDLGSGTASTQGTVSTSGQVITVSGITGTTGQTVIVRYGSTAGGAGGQAVSRSTGGTNNFPVQSKGSSGGTLTTISSSPLVVTTVPPDGAGTCVVSPTSVGVNQSTTLTFTCTIASGGMQSGAFAVTVPAGWTAPQTGSIATAGYTLISGTSTAGTPGTVATSGQTINVTGVTGTSGQTVVVVYGSTTGNPAGATTSSSTAGTNNFPVTQKSTTGGTLTAISSSPLQVTTTSSDGVGSCAVTPNTATGGQPTALTFTCTLAGTMTAGAFQVAIPSGWTTPQTGTPTGAGYTVLLGASSTATTPGTLAVSGMNVDITGITGTNGQTVVFVYGSTTGGGPGSTPPTTGGTVTFTSKQKSTAGGTLTGITSPTVTVTVASTPLLPPAPNGGTVDDTQVEITWDGPIDPTGIPPLSSLKVVSSVTGTHNVIAISISNGKLLLTLDTPVTPGETARAIYTKPSGPGLKGTNGVDVVSFDQPLANRGVTTGTGSSPVGIPPLVTGGASTCGSSTLFFMTATYGSGRTITLVFCRDFNEGVVPAPSAFQVSTSEKGRLVPVKVVVSGRTVLLTLPEGKGLVSGESAVVSYAEPDASALVDTITPAANRALSFMGAQVVNLTGGTAAVAARAANEALPATPPRLVSSSPDDGITVPRMLAITMLASKDVTWENVTVLRSDNTTLELPDFSGARYTAPFVPTLNGPYMVTATISDGRNAPVPVTINFSVFQPPAVPSEASAGRAPQVSKVSQGGAGGAIVASDGSASVSWPGTLFKSKTIVTVEPLPVVASPKGVRSITANFAVGSIAISVIARDPAKSDALITEFDTPIHLEFPNGTPLGIPSYSQNGLLWIALPKLEKNELPAGQKDGYFRDANNTVHIWTRHLTYFAMLKAGDLLKVTAAPHIWAINKRRTIAFMVQSGRKATLTAQPQLYVKGSKSHVTLWKPLKMKQGTRVFRYYLPKKHKMVGTFELRVKFKVGKRILVRKRTIEFLPEKYKPAAKPVVVRINGLNNAARLAKSLKKSYAVTAYRTGPTSIPYVADKKKKVDAVIIDLTRSPYDYANKIGLIRNLRWIFPDLRIAVITKDKKMAVKADQWGSDATSRPPGGSYQLFLTLKRALKK